MSFSSSALSLSDLTQLRSHLHEYLQANDVYEKIKTAVNTFTYTQKAEDAIGQTDFTEGLQQANLAQAMVDFLIRSSQTGSGLPSNGKHLNVKVLSGSNFPESDGSNLVVVLIFGSNRVCTYPVPAQPAPAFNQEFNFPIGPPFHSLQQISFHQILHCPERFLVVLLKEDPGSQFRTVLSTREVEWRDILESGSDQLSIDLLGREENLVPMAIGTLNIQLKIRPLPISKSSYCERAVISKHLSDSWLKKTEAAKQFQMFVKAWWAEFIQIRSDHEQRTVKIFVSNERNERCFVCLTVEPIHDNRVLPSPMHAARFVRMVPKVSEISVGGEQTATWTSLPVLLSRGHGSVEEHCVLLCSLLLGFGTSAFICCGTNVDGPYTWVMTKETNRKILFWDSISGTVYSLERSQEDKSERRRFPFRTIGCVFSYKEYFANIQIDNAVLSTCWDFSNSVLWKSIPSEIIQLCSRNNPIRILPCKIDPVASSECLDAALKRHIEDYRGRHLNADTKWDDVLAFSLNPALVAYEYQFITGATFGNSLFQQAIKNLTPLHHVFRAYPAQFDHMDPDKIIAHFVNEAIPSEILNKVGTSLSFAIRSYIVPYAEQVAVTWVMIAIKWRQ